MSTKSADVSAEPNCPLADVIEEVAVAAEKLVMPTCTIDEHTKMDMLHKTIERAVRETDGVTDTQLAYSLGEHAAREIVLCGVHPDVIKTDANLLR